MGSADRSDGMGTESTTKEITTEIAIVFETTIRDNNYEARGVKVMLGFELEEIYRYTPRK